MRIMGGAGLALVLLYAGISARAGGEPKTQPAPAVVELFEDEAEPLIGQMDNEGGVWQGTATREGGDKYSGICSIRVTPIQRYSMRLKGWNYAITEKPRPGEYRWMKLLSFVPSIDEICSWMTGRLRWSSPGGNGAG